MGIISSGYYQVPNKIVGKLNINNDIVYVPTISSDVDINFGTLALSSSIPVASTSEVGGFKLVNADTGVISETDQIYAVQLSTNNEAYVQVRWENTQYFADRNQGCLCVDGTAETIADVGYAVFGISSHSITEEQLCAASFGDMVFSSQPYSKFETVSAAITNPILSVLDSEISNRIDQFANHEISNQTQFNEHLSLLNNLSADLSLNYYDTTQTLSTQQIYDLLSALNNDISTYYSKQENNPAYLCSNTSSAIELKNAFDSKQNNLSIINTINSAQTYTQNDIPDVSAVIKYVKTETEKIDATFLGHYDSWSAVPDTSADYKVHGVQKTPDKNDYIYVTITQSDGSGITDYGTCKFKMISSDWNESLKKNNWTYEIKINDVAFTDDQLNAINSGITTNKVKSIEYNTNKIDSLSNYVINLIGNSCKKETWIFELQDGTTIEKTMLVQ